MKYCTGGRIKAEKTSDSRKHNYRFFFTSAKYRGPEPEELSGMIIVPKSVFSGT